MSGAQKIILHPYHGMPLTTLPGFGMDIRNMCATFPGVSLKNGVDIWTLVRKACVFRLVVCNYLVLG